jgi:hypothetical protein
VNVGENAAVGDVAFALNYWRNSDIHRRTVVNAGYREVGVAALPYKSAYLFIAVFGSRPDVLPALVNPETHQLQLTNETYRWKSTGALIQEAKQVRLFGSDGRPLNKEPIPWQPKLAIPDGAGGKLYVVYSDGAAQVVTEVDMSKDVAILPGYIPSPTTVAAQPTPNAVAGQPTAIPASNLPGAPVTNTPRAPARTPTPLPSPIPAATVTPTPTPAAGRLVIVYDNLSLTVINTSSGPVDISKLQLVSVSAGVTFSATRWVQVSQVPLQSFPARQCLQIKLVNRAVLMAPDCRIVRGVVEFLPRQFFWTQASFEVRVANTVLATCQTSAGRCEVELPR